MLSGPSVWLYARYRASAVPIVVDTDRSSSRTSGIVCFVNSAAMMTLLVVLSNLSALVWPPVPLQMPPPVLLEDLQPASLQVLRAVPPTVWLPLPLKNFPPVSSLWMLQVSTPVSSPLSIPESPRVLFPEDLPVLSPILPAVSLLVLSLLSPLLSYRGHWHWCRFQCRGHDIDIYLVANVIAMTLTLDSMPASSR